MEGLWIIIAIVVLVFRVLNKAGEITGEMKERLPEVLGEKRLPPVFKDWGFPWDEENEGDEDNGWDEYAESPEKVVHSPKNTAKNTIMANPMETTTETTMEAAMEPQTNLQQEKEATGIDRHPLMDSASLINGLILSEILQPPKSRRPGRRF